MNRGVASNEEASLVFSLVLSNTDAYLLRADFREDRVAQPHEGPAVLGQFLGHCERMRGDDRNGAAQLQFLSLGHDRVDREADRDRACPIAFARKRGAAAELFGEA